MCNEGSLGTMVGVPREGTPADLKQLRNPAERLPALKSLVYLTTARVAAA